MRRHLNSGITNYIYVPDMQQYVVHMNLKQ